MSIRELLSERFGYLMPATAVYVEFLADSFAAVAVTVASNIERLLSSNKRTVKAETKLRE
ncbi:MAG: hypothetical protein WBO18_13220 [Gammaproteobacteria bacterium]